jgi:hypothetical protein
MPTLSLTPGQQDELRVAHDNLRRDFASQHRATRTAVLREAPPALQAGLGAWLEALAGLVDEVNAWSLAAEQASVPELATPVDLASFEALVATPLEADAGRALLGAIDRLGDARTLALAALLHGHSHPLRTELRAELSRTAGDPATWRLVDWFAGAGHHELLADVVEARHRATQARDEARALPSDATRWLAARGHAVSEPFAVSIRMEDVPQNHPKHRHLREQTSHLDVRITTEAVRGPSLDVGWSLVLRGARGEARHGFSPSSWSGEVRQLQAGVGEAPCTLTEPSPSLARKPRTHTFATTLESLPAAIDEIERVTGRSFHRERAPITAHVGAQRAPAIEEATRAWLAR